MPTTFLSLPLKIREKVSQALSGTVITIPLQNRHHRENRITTKGQVKNIDRPYVGFPENSQLRKEYLAPQQNAIALLYVSKQTYADLAVHIYSKIRLHILAPPVQEHWERAMTRDNFLRCITRSRSPLKTLVERVSTVSSPDLLLPAQARAIEEHLSTVHNLKHLILFDSSIVMRANYQQESYSNIWSPHDHQFEDERVRRQVDRFMEDTLGMRNSTGPDLTMVIPGMSLRYNVFELHINGSDGEVFSTWVDGADAVVHPNDMVLDYSLF